MLLARHQLYTSSMPYATRGADLFGSRSAVHENWRCCEIEADNRPYVTEDTRSATFNPPRDAPCDRAGGAFRNEQLDSRLLEDLLGRNRSARVRDQSARNFRPRHTRQLLSQLPSRALTQLHVISSTVVRWTVPKRYVPWRPRPETRSRGRSMIRARSVLSVLP